MSFDVIPAIDIIDGRCVRLFQGQFEKKTVYDQSPIELARQFEDAGFERLHVVDLDGAKAGVTKNLETLERICKSTQLVVDFGGGVKTTEGFRSVLDAGAIKVSVGTAAVKQPEIFNEWIETFGASSIFLGTDVENELLAVRGWQERTTVKIIPFLRKMITLGIDEIFATDISKDGAMQGPGYELYESVVEEFPSLSVVASGGVRNQQDLDQLVEMGVSGAIVGKAFYEGTLSFKEALDVG